MTNNTKKIAVIAGSTGLIGGHLLQQLLNNPLYDKIYVPGRKAPKLTDPKIVFELCDFSEFKNLPKNGNIDLFCSLGTTIKKAGSQDQFREVDFDAVVNFARWGASISCNHFVVVSSIGANPKSRNFYLRTKGQMEQVLKAISPYGEERGLSVWRKSGRMVDETSQLSFNRKGKKIQTHRRRSSS